MPYGNKGLHFGHVGGVFVPADVYARFLRDRIGPANVLFVSGTDCYGSPIDEGYRKLVENEGFTGSIADYVKANQCAQAASLAAFDISLDIYQGSGMDESGECHRTLSDELLRRLYDCGHLQLLGTDQFYDDAAMSFLNGRQVVGHCPVQGCRSEHAWADECDLGHQYQPSELINPVSTLTGSRPSMRRVENWYFDLPEFKGLLDNYIEQLMCDNVTRKLVPETMAEFLVPPIIYLKDELLDDYQALSSTLPQHRYRPTPQGKASFELEFDCIADRDQARSLLDAAGLRYRSGKALTPFRITGNIDWGVPAPDLDHSGRALTIWCWPESLWAPISFTQAALRRAAAAGIAGSTTAVDAGNDAADAEAAAAEAVGAGSQATATARATAAPLEWPDFWCDDTARVYQFIGQDNIYFYGVVQTALWEALAALDDFDLANPLGTLKQTHLIANHHLLFLDKKASSSGTLKPPLAEELLEYYRAEQLRAHFVSLGLGMKAVNFRPKPLNPKAAAKDSDPVLKDGQVLTGILNRLARSCFYAVQNEFGGQMPLGEISPEVGNWAQEAVRLYEQAMFLTELHLASSAAADLIRRANKHWSEHSRSCETGSAERRQLLIDCFYLLRVCLLLEHPIAPRGSAKAFEYFALSCTEAEFFSWEHVDASCRPAGFEAFVDADAKARASHSLRELLPRTDFFECHPSQFAKS
ncbi:MAG: class I tRNA ligase family protein [Actinomycetia bacterium]|nr:class I tRNA ligase family protein [Actinomycetes bacterium]